MTECYQCKSWKRINHECRNLQIRVDYKDFKSVLHFLEELARLESISKMAPEMTKTLVALKDNFKCQYEKERTALTNKLYNLEQELIDSKALMKKYKQDLGEL